MTEITNVTKEGITYGKPGKEIFIPKEEIEAIAISVIVRNSRDLKITDKHLDKEMPPEKLREEVERNRVNKPYLVVKKVGSNRGIYIGIDLDDSRQIDMLKKIQVDLKDKYWGYGQDALVQMVLKLSFGWILIAVVALVIVGVFLINWFF